MSPRLRTATEADAQAIAGLINLAYRVEDFFKIGDRTDLAEVRELLREHRFLVLEQDGRIVGSVLVEIEGERGYFGMLSIDPACQGLGFARRLIEAAEEAAIAGGCREMDLVYVNLREELPAFYGKFGYRETGTEPWPEAELHRISRPAHFIRMSRPLDRAHSSALAKGSQS